LWGFRRKRVNVSILLSPLSTLPDQGGATLGWSGYAKEEEK
jgi:hypothetical protein